MRCPVDKTICRRKQLDKLEIDVCPTCQGVWLEKDEVRNLSRYLSIPNLTQVDELLAEWESVEHEGTIPREFWSEVKIECPYDRVKMEKHYFAGSNIGVDQCQVCKGFWLDGGELHAVAKYVEPDYDMERAWQDYIRDEREMRKDLEGFKGRMNREAALIALSPKYLFFSIASFITRYLVDILSRDSKL